MQDSVVDLFLTYKLTLVSITVDSSKKLNLKKQKPRWSMINSLLYMTDFNYHTHNFSKCKMRLKKMGVVGTNTANVMLYRINVLDDQLPSSYVDSVSSYHLQATTKSHG